MVAPERRVNGHPVGIATDELYDGRGTEVAELWEFLVRSRFLYPEKLAVIDPARTQATWAALLEAPGSLAKTCLLKRDGDIRAHVSAVRLFAKTWTLQHLAALLDTRSTLTRGQAVSVSMIELLDREPEAEWVKVWYRPTSGFPLRLFESFARRFADSELSELATYDYLVSSTDRDGAAVPGLAFAASDVVVTGAEPADIERIGTYFLDRRTATCVADDLTTPRLTLAAMREPYAALGLERRREVLVAKHRGDLLGFALLEISSIGLNLSELTSAFRVFPLAPHSQVELSLIAAARQRYRELGRARCFALAESAEAGHRTSYERLGFSRARQYTCWTWHRAHFRDFCRHVREFSR
jgi:hypothetical protein